jgi:chromosome segregation ATPase
MAIPIAIIWIVFVYVLMKFCTRRSPCTRNQHLAVYQNFYLKSEILPETRQPPAVDSGVLTTSKKISGEEIFYRFMEKIEDNNNLKRDNQRLVSQVTKLQFELSTLLSERGEFQSVRDELIATRCQLDAKKRDIIELEKSILHMKNNQTPPKKDNVDRIDELQDQYKKACARIASMHREVRGIHAARTLLQRDKATLVNELESKTRELEEEKVSSNKKLKDLQMENQENLKKVRNFHQTLLDKRNVKIDELQKNVSELNFKLDELEEDRWTEMEEMRKKYSKVIQKHNEHLVQLESRVEDLTKKNWELNEAMDQLEVASYSLPDYYRLLKLDRGAPEEQIRSAYRKKMRQIHPDKIKQMDPDADEKVYGKAKRLSEVLHRGNQILQNPRLKYQYDIWLDMVELKKTEHKMKEYEAYEERKRNK